MKSAIVGLLLAAPAIAQAQGYYDNHDYGAGGVSVLIGTDTAFNGTPWTGRLTLEAQGDLVRGTGVALAFAMPATWMSSGRAHFGLGRQSVIEAPPSLRLRLGPELPVRPFLDAGIGAVFVTTNDQRGFLFRNRVEDTGWMTRAAFGIEIGSNHGPMLVLEPVQWQTYHLGRDYSRWGAEIGIGGRF